MKDLTITYLKPEQITPYVNNARIHSKEQIDMLKASIKEFGMCTPIGIIDGTIVYGHARYTALCELGYTEIPTVDLSHLTNAQRKAYVIADNKIADEAGYNDDMIKSEIQSIKELDADFDLRVTGFEDLYDSISDKDPDLEIFDEYSQSDKIDFKVECENIEQLNYFKEYFGIKTAKTKADDFIKIIDNRNFNKT